MVGFSKIDDFGGAFRDQNISKTHIHMIDSTSMKQVEGLNNFGEEKYFRAFSLSVITLDFVIQILCISID